MSKRAEAVLFIFIDIILPAAVVSIVGDITQSGFLWDNIFFFADLFPFVSLLLLFKEDIRADLRQLQFRKYKRELSCVLIGFILIDFYNYFLFLKGINQSENENLLTDISVEMNMGLFFLYICVVGPLLEEYVFRMCIFRIFNRTGAKYLVSSVSFGMIHMLSSANMDFISFVTNSVPYIGIGFLFAWLYDKSKNVILCSAVHGLHNSISFICVLLSRILS